jgi:hypothetical protein
MALGKKKNGTVFVLQKLTAYRNVQVGGVRIFGTLSQRTSQKPIE